MKSLSALAGLFGAKLKIQPTHVATVDEFRVNVLTSELPVIVNVWSATCPPCRQLAPVLVEIATAYQGRVRVVEVSTEAEPDVLASLSIQATPTTVVFDKGIEVGRVTGFRPKSWFDEMIKVELTR
ncbi:MAG: thioredoxin family protein [Pseudomonadota bacterium]|nr:thioredoxin family protein [Pseudomonadota bacterium]